MDSQFNPDTFIDLEVTGALDTQLILVPRGEWIGKIGEIKPPRVTQSKDGNTYVFLDIPIKVTDPDVERHCQRPEPQVRHSISLDIIDGRLDMGPGKNIGLGQLRDALGLNDPTAPFSARMLSGKGIKVKIEHTKDKTDPTKTYANVQGVSKI